VRGKVESNVRLKLTVKHAGNQKVVGWASKSGGRKINIERSAQGPEYKEGLITGEETAKSRSR